MFLAYMDESGNSGDKSDPKQPIHFLGCLVVEDASIRPLEEAIAAIADKHFSALGREFEFHGPDLYGGWRSCKGVPVGTRIEVAEEVLNAAAKHASAFGYTGIDKRKSFASDHPHRIAFTLMIEGLEPFLRERDALGLIVADEYNEIAHELIADVDRFKTSGTSWGFRRVTAKRIVDSIHFVKSHDNRAIQACDLVTYFTLKGIRIRESKRAEFEKLGQPSWKYWSWVKGSYTRSEEATMRLAEIAGSIRRIRAKIFP